MIEVEHLKGLSVAEQKVEIVERKGLGHPDYICDSIMEAISVALSGEYIKEFGTVLHHNIDKGFLVAGQVEKMFGRGSITKPMELIIGDRATFEVGEKKIPVGDIAIEASKRWIRENMRFIDPSQDIYYRVVLAPGSVELTDIFLRPGEVRVANDTSAAVGYYPLTSTEKAVLEFEKFLNAKDFKERYPETGEDVKIMGLRMGSKLDMTVAMPMISRFILNEDDYFEKKVRLEEEMQDFLARFKEFGGIDVNYNTLDERGRGINGIYLSLLGTSAEDADSGQVGRGNRVNGLISMNRPMGTEAAAGKNPVSHVGKIYNILSHKVAKDIYENIKGIKEIYILLLSRIGTPIDRPQVASAQVLLNEGVSIEKISKQIEDHMEDALTKIGDFCMDLSKGKYPVC
ncbi:MAG: methionine adenosyltransferase [Nitrospirota bacterium]